MKQFKAIILGIFILLSTGLYANTVNMAPIISYLLSDTATPQEIAIDKIKAYADDETQPPPTVEDYEDAGVIGATAENIDIINNAVAALTSEDVDTAEEIQQVLYDLGINMPPTADAGSDKYIQFGNAVYLRGSGSDEDGEIVSYVWTKNGAVIATEAEFLYTPAAVGTVTLTLTVTDNDGATGSDSMHVTTQDTVAPAISVLGTNPAKALVGENYTDAGATAEDTHDGNLTVEVSGEVNTDVPGIYTITYSATDNAGNTATATRRVNVFPMRDGVIVDNYTTCLDVLGCEVKAEAMAIDSSGNIYVTGHSGYEDWFGGSSSMIIWKYTSAGVQDTSFGTNGIVRTTGAAGLGYYNDYGYGITLDSSGNVYVAGTSSDNGDDSHMVIWKHTSTGVLDTAFGTNGSAVHQGSAGVDFENIGYGIVLDSAGHVHVLGSTYNASGEQYMVLWEYEAVSGGSGMTFENTTSFPIPDGGGGGPGIAISEINVAGATDSITKVTVTLDITHYYIFDLEIRLISSVGTIIRLSSPPLYSCCNGQNYSDTTFDDSAITLIADVAPPFTGTYRPWESLATFEGEDANGIWKLQIHDYVFVHTGILNSWGITIE
ncbi:MAG: DUF5011 domain-containing protein [Campylobacterota bacterium]|nr:DUF5011 domain-containing protein [Campylobacterota bacterium]